VVKWFNTAICKIAISRVRILPLPPNNLRLTLTEKKDYDKEAMRRLLESQKPRGNEFKPVPKPEGKKKKSKKVDES
jgi:hypothetical protein